MAIWDGDSQDRSGSLRQALGPNLGRGFDLAAADARDFGEGCCPAGAWMGLGTHRGHDDRWTLALAPPCCPWIWPHQGLEKEEAGWGGAEGEGEGKDK